MKLAVIKTGGKQYIVSEGRRIKIEKLKAEKDQIVEFDQVLLVSENDKIVFGKPTTGTKVTAKVLAQGRSPKVIVEKYKPKVRYHKVYGHRQPFTEVQIEKIA